jgi:DNA-binding transcriptional MerR regulator
MDDSVAIDKVTFNMKAVVRETGLKPDTLRAWERRYGLPQPRRSSGGHRLYSERDIDTLKWLIFRQEEGFSISRAVDLWHQLESEGQDPLQAMPLISARTTITPIIGTTMEGLHQEWIEACKAFDEAKAEQVLTRAFALYPPEAVCIQILMKSLSEIGKEWYRGDITIQQEHFASELAIRRLETLISASPPPTLAGRILILCPAGEDHTFSSLLLTYLLRRNGRYALFLGANVPQAHLQEAIAKIKPHLIILTAQQLHTAANMLEMINALQKYSFHLAFGGRIFNLIPSIRDRIPGHFLGEDLEKAPERIAHLLNQTPSPLKPVQGPSQDLRRTQDIFRDRLTDIEGLVRERMKPAAIPYMQLVIANRNMAQNIIAALSLGDISLLETDMKWMEGLLRNHGIRDDSLKDYLAVYADAVRKETDDRARIISDYLTALLDGNDEPIHNDR